MPQKRQNGVPHPPVVKVSRPVSLKLGAVDSTGPISQTEQSSSLNAFSSSPPLFFEYYQTSVSSWYFFSFLTKKKNLTGGHLPCNAVLISTIHQHASAIGVHMPLPPPTPPLPSRLSQSTRLSFLHHTATFHWLPVSHTAMSMLPCYSVTSSQPFLPLLRPHVCSLCLHLYCFPENGFISMIFLDFMYMC